MSNTATQNMAMIPLPEGKRKAVQVGCIFLMLSVAMSGLALATLSSPILESINALEYVSLFTILGSLGVSIMTPIGGKLGDLIGRRNIVVIPGIICALCGIGIAFVRSLVPLLILRVLLSLAQGAFTAAPYIIVGLINEKKDIPKAMGLLAASVAIGGFGGSIIAGILTDMGMMTSALLVSVIPLILGIILIGKNMPNQKKQGKVNLDVFGTLALIVTLSGILLALNYATALGWGHPLVIGGFIIGFLALALLVWVEYKVEDPLIPMKLFRNVRYTALLLVTFCAYFYIGAINTYAPIASIKVLGTSAGIAGSLQMPRTLICAFLPAAAGVWVGKKAENNWKALTVATLFAAIAMFVLGFTTGQTSVLIYYLAIALTGIAEGFRSVSVTPFAQMTLDQKDIGIGTSLINFTNSLSGTIGAAIMGAAYNFYTVENAASVINIQRGCNAVFRITAVFAVIGMGIVLFVIRPQMNKK